MSTLTFLMSRMVYFNNMKRNVGHIKVTQKPRQPMDYIEKDHSDNETGNTLPSHGILFYMHNPRDRIKHTMVFVISVEEYWLKRAIAQWVHHEGSIRRPIAIRANALTTELSLAPVYVYMSVCVCVCVCKRVRARPRASLSCLNLPILPVSQHLPLKPGRHLHG